MVGNQRVMRSTHINTVPDAEIIKQRQITLGAREVRQRMTATHRPVMPIAITKAVRLNWAS